MPILIYNSNSTFVWPEHVTHVDAYAFGGGAGGNNGGGSSGGGGGGGGEFKGGTCYRGTESSLALVVGNGGSPGAAGTDSTITQGTTVWLRATGGGAPSGTHGGAGGGTGLGIGGSGGDSFFGRGGGGGAGGGGDGTDATTPGSPDDHGQGGVPAHNYFTGGYGGQGGDVGIAASSGVAPGGGGGGGGTAGGVSGGSGAKGRIIIVYGNETGTTRFSSGCCCGSCDLTKQQMPDSITVTIATTPYTPDGWPFGPPPTVTSGIDYDRYEFGCNPEDLIHISYGPETYDTRAIDHRRSSFLNGKQLTLELTEFIADSTNYTSRCFWKYECEIQDPSINDGALPGFDWGDNPRWCLLGDSPGGSVDGPIQTQNCSDETDCDNCQYYGWIRRGEVRANCALEMSIYREKSSAKYFWLKNISVMFKYKIKGGTASTDIDWTEAEDPNLDNWMTSNFSSWDYAFGPPIGFSGSAGSTDVLYDTAQEAMDAMKAAVIDEVIDEENGGPITFYANWVFGPGDAYGVGGVWYQSITYTFCDTLPNGFPVCGETSDTWEFNLEGHQELYDYAYMSFSTA